MKMQLQLVRQPIRTMAFLILLSMACAFACLGFGVFLSAQTTLESIEKGFVTIALPTNQTEMVEYETESGIHTMEQSVITPQMWEYIQGLPGKDGPVTRAVQQEFVSAWIPELQSATSAKEAGAYHTGLNRPYDNGVFVVTITEIGEPDPQSVPGKVVVPIKSKLEETVLLHPDFEPRENLTLHCVFSSEEAYHSENLQVGQDYIVYGQSYVDYDLKLKNDLATILKLEASEISWDHISRDTKPYFPGDSSYAAVYVNGDKAVGLTEAELQAIDAAGVFVQNVAENYTEDFCLPDIYGNPSPYTGAELLTTPTIARLDSPVEDFMQQEGNALWQRAAEEGKIRNRSFPVIGTDFLESMYLFQQSEAAVVSGRSFTEEEYGAGDKVCMISEIIAQANGVAVGDTISLQYFWGADPYDELTKQGTNNLMAQSYCQKLGFEGQKEAYTVIGIYRQSDLWSQALYAFTPNTIFVPNASMDVPTHTDKTGIYYTLVVENGRADEVVQLLAEQGYPKDTLLFFDNGYSEIADTLRHFRESAVQIFAASGATWVVVLGAYLVFFVLKQRRVAGLMLSLGAGKKNTAISVFVTAMLPIFLAVVIGAWSSALLLGKTMQRVFAPVADNIHIAFNGAFGEGHTGIPAVATALPATTVFAGILQIAISGATCWLCACVMTGKNPRFLLRK